MKCILVFGLIALLVIQATFAEEDNQCTEGESKKAIDNCNDCYCTKGIWACTKKGCDGQKLTIMNKRAADTPCKTGESKKDDCNSCQCSNGNWLCTQMACPPK